MKKYFLFVILIVFVFGLLSGCAKIEDISAESDKPAETTEPVDSNCTTGTTMMDVPLNENSVYYPYDVGAFTVRPNNGCNLPTLYCVYAATFTDSGGPSCVVIKE